jgi:hypothetical protein
VIDGFLVIDGQEKHIRKLLEKKRTELFPLPLPSLGPRVKIVRPLGRNHTTNLETNNANSSLKWKPKKVLVGRFPEHSAKINQIAMAPDFSFFASCSADGTGNLNLTF